MPSGPSCAGRRSVMRSSIRLSRLAPGPNKDKDEYRISIPFEPPNPYELMPQGSDATAAVSTGRTESQEGSTRASYCPPFSPDTVNAIERDPNQPPQVVIPDAPEVVVADAPEAVDLQGAGASSTSPIFDGSRAEEGHVHSPTVTFAEPEGHDRTASAAWLKKRPRCVKLFLIAVVVVCVIVAISTGVAVAVTATSQSGYVGLSGPDKALPSDIYSPPAPSHTGLTSDSPSTSSSSSSSSSGDPKESPTETEAEEPPNSTNTSTAKPADDTSRCKSKKTWMNQVDFVATADTAIMAEWIYAPVSSPQDCCMACYTNSLTNEGCLAWYWDAYQKAEQFSCTNYHHGGRGTTEKSKKISNSSKESDEDTCPNGKLQMVFNTQNEERKDSVGDVGPCGQLGKV